MAIPYSVLDLAPVLEGGTLAQSFRNMVDLAQRTEGWPNITRTLAWRAPRPWC